MSVFPVRSTALAAALLSAGFGVGTVAAHAAGPIPDSRFVKCDGTESDEFPMALVLECKKRTMALFGNNWNSWGGRYVTGTSVFIHIPHPEMDQPHQYPVAIKAHTPAKVGPLKQYYTKLDVTFLKNKPASMKKTVTFTFAAQKGAHPGL